MIELFPPEDWGAHRLVPDFVRALVAGQTIQLRYPNSVRPWQFVLEPLSGYLWLAARLVREGCKFAEAWNLGPFDRLAVSVRDVVQALIQLWGSGDWEDASSDQNPHEAGLLTLSCEKAANLLGWQPAYTWHQALVETADWFKAYYEGGPSVDMYDTCVEQIERYVDRARELDIIWAMESEGM